MDQGGYGSGWTVVDAYQIMIHFFTAEQRENYALEKLWRDAEVVNLKAIGAKSKAPAKAVVKAKVVKKKVEAKPAKALKAVAKKPVVAKVKAVAKPAKPAAKKAAVKKAAK
jgi:ribosome-associated protein